VMAICSRESKDPDLECLGGGDVPCFVCADMGRRRYPTGLLWFKGWGFIEAIAVSVGSDLYSPAKQMKGSPIRKS